MDTYKAQVTRIFPDNHAEIRMDFGFRIYASLVFAFTQLPEWCEPGARIYAYHKPAESGQGTFSFGSPPQADTSPPLWHYRADLMRVIDGDTLDARVHLPLNMVIEERFRLEGIDAGEMARELGGDEGKSLAAVATSHLRERIERNYGRMRIYTSRRGKWRRWLARVYLDEQDTSLNTELVALGYAQWMNAMKARFASNTAFLQVYVQRDTRDALIKRARSLDTTAADLLQQLLRDYLD